MTQKRQLCLALSLACTIISSQGLAATVEKTVTTERTVVHEEVNVQDNPILARIAADRELQQFSNLLRSSDIELNDFKHSNYTIFAPTDAAFNELDAKTQRHLKYMNPAALGEVAKAHIVPGEVYIRDLPGGQSVVYSVDGKPIEIRKLGINDYYANGRHIESEVDGRGGVIYKIGGFLMSPDSIADGMSRHKGKVSILVPEDSNVTIETKTTTESR